MNRLFQQQFKEYGDLIDNYLQGLPWSSDTLGRAMSYSLLSEGKRIRPVLVLAAAAVAGGDARQVLPAAAALELIHTYSLIHDDLPAMDDDDYRRGRPANHKVFGEAHAILAGDALLTYAFELLARPLPVPPHVQLRVIQEVAQAAGPEGMVGGQVADLAGEGRALTLEEIEEIHHKKTGALLTVSARAGALLGGGTEQTVAALTRYARALGLAFQIKDDILDLEGDSAVLGKPVGSDVRQGKSTFPALLGLAAAKRRLADQVALAKDAVAGLGEQASFLRDLADFVANRQR